jgi:hypothetical protein
MNTKMTRRQLGLLLSQAAVAGPALALANKLAKPVEAPSPADPSSPTGAPVYVVLWFDTEDYILPASDDAAKRLADFLTAQGVRANFKVVGEKARVLEARHRTDVIAALNRHEIGYHSNFHSQQPTIAEYESVLDWEQGAAEFDRRERAGFDDVARIFGHAPTCFGQPGSSWAPQAYAALKKWGVHVYLDDGQHVRLDGKPFWYGGLLNIFNIDAGRLLEPNEDWSNIEAAKSGFTSLHRQFSMQPAGGLVSFMFHPTQFVSQRFWDAVNFSNGANPPRSEWKLQPQLSHAQSEQAFKYFEDLIRHMKSLPDVRFITASQALELYRDKAQSRSYTPLEWMTIARHVTSQVSFQLHERYALSASEIFALLNAIVAKSVSNGANEPIILRDTPYGPSSAAFDVEPNQISEVSWSQFSRTALDVSRFLDRNHQIPNAVWMGSAAISPESYLHTLASVVPMLLRKQSPLESVKILPAELAAGNWIAKDSLSIWNWPIFPPGFHAPHLMELARLQAWTLKPALLPMVR